MSQPSIRLTNMDRDSIVADAIEASFQARVTALDAAEDALARRCYEAVFPEKVRKQAAALPKGWLRLDKCLRFNVLGLSAELHVSGDGLPVPFGSRGYCQRLGSIADETLAASVRSHLDEVEAMKADRSKAKGAVNALVHSVTTVKALREIWPEGEPFYGKIGPKDGARLPAPRVVELNAMLGLPAKAA